MSARQITCLVIVCDGCGDEGEELDGVGPVHWSNRAEAIEALTGTTDGRGWEITPTAAGPDLCPRCVCRRDDHDWTAVDYGPHINAYCPRCCRFDLVPV